MQCSSSWPRPRPSHRRWMTCISRSPLTEPRWPVASWLAFEAFHAAHQQFGVASPSHPATIAATGAQPANQGGAMRTLAFCAVLLLVGAAATADGPAYTIKLKTYPDKGQTLLCRDTEQNTSRIRF